MQMPRVEFRRRKSGGEIWKYGFNNYTVVINKFFTEDDYMVHIFPQKPECPDIIGPGDEKGYMIVPSRRHICFREKDRDIALKLMEEAFEVVSILNKGIEYLFDLYEDDGRS